MRRVSVWVFAWKDFSLNFDLATPQCGHGFEAIVHWCLMFPSTGRLYGASLIQLYNYCEVSTWNTDCSPMLIHSPIKISWKSDRWYIKYPVCLSVISDTVHHWLLVRPTYEYLVTNFGNFDALQKNDAWVPTIVQAMICAYCRHVGSLLRSAYLQALLLLLPSTF